MRKTWLARPRQPRDRGTTGLGVYATPGSGHQGEQSTLHGIHLGRVWALSGTSHRRDSVCNLCIRGTVEYGRHTHYIGMITTKSEESVKKEEPNEDAKQ